ncbi:MAG: S-methyl-5'-thioinosine phosphorylase [Burkholderiaceae bacterium]
MNMFAIIGGSGLAKLSALDSIERRVMRTPYGEPSGAITLGRLGGRDIVFLARHGYGHTIAPHEINYRANIWALKELKVRGILAVATVGSVNEALVPGTLVVPDQLIDYTYGRKSTFFEGSETPVTHIDFTEPYSNELRLRLLAAAAGVGEAVVDGGTYACTQGPRLETAAEIERIRRDGGDLVGMTGMPEASLAREAGLAYASLGVVVNHAAGLGASKHQILLADLESVMKATVARALRVLEATVSEPFEGNAK